MSDDFGTKIWIASKLAQATTTLAPQFISDRPKIPGVLGQLVVMEGVAADFSIDGRPVASQPPGHFIDGDFLINETMKEAAIGKGQLRIASGHVKSPK
ncbi:hypothetical protein AGR3A_pa10065 [Agrobacterium tomkonis CFBP 6623]|uniref:Uncharacterized protein n=1 Tax=Agrobacterium tomkonis CFBP 6623 TaxID=1183432 RepID=A0A1S7S870_9HYPH|nr:hypothetical protein AGR3A_pa10065 [Agrobacterium tomkonis CFBP 6623]CUX65701.1 hypothetical protein AGR5A_pa30027 [Agrobacterium genomosp. 5 str. CFBP 6626]